MNGEETRERQNTRTVGLSQHAIFDNNDWTRILGEFQSRLRCENDDILILRTMDGREDVLRHSS
jgi:hypothetical protein